jgi:predicted amidohydrolase YtcJ
MLIRNAEIAFGRVCDIRVAQGVVAEIGDGLPQFHEESVLNADGRALLPGLNDHHFHLLAFAAARESLRCGPPDVTTAPELRQILEARQASTPSQWIRGVGYHESVAGDIDRHWLDTVAPTAPVRIQHRGGRLWVLNSAALDLVAAGDRTGPLERIGGRVTGRLYDGDAWLRQRMGSQPPSLHEASRYLLSRGVTGITDTTPTNGVVEFEFLRKAQVDGDLVQDIVMMGGAALESTARSAIQIGHRKIHLREAALPDIAEIEAEIVRCHGIGRRVAFHCVTLIELLFALNALDFAGSIPGDRIEHAGVAPPETMPLIAAHGLTVVTQPNFIAERGDAYLSDVDPADRNWLYRLRGFREAGIKLAAGTDAPFGGADPWNAMAAAVSRRTAKGHLIGPDEALTPEEALGLFLGPLSDPAGPARPIEPGAPADLCLIDRPWAEARRDLAQVMVDKTFKAGEIVWSR